MNRFKVWPHLTIAAAALVLVAGLGVYLWRNHEPTASAQDLPYAARIQRVDGEVAFNDNGANTEANQDWIAATVNQPFSEGDRIYTRENSRTSLAFSGRNFARLEPNTSLDCVSLEDHRTQLALRDGSAIFDVGYLESDELFEVATPNGAVDFVQPGLYNVGFDRNGSVLVSVLSGVAQVVGLGGSGQVSKGEILTLVGEAASQLALSRLDGQDAGRFVDDYYRYQYPNSYDGRYSNYDAYLSDPYYYDPSRRFESYQYVSSDIPGVYDLDSYGDWQNVAGYGNCWRPRVDADWVPYQQGQWINEYPYGPTWVSSEAWGYAPYHYGRWANVGNQWFWVPDGVNTSPQFAPALVAFVPLNDTNQIGWVPLGPGDPYMPRYYDQNWQPRYLSRTNVTPAQLLNLGIPGAVTVVQVDAFGRDLDRRSIRRIDQQRLAAARATLDPLTFTPLRNAVIHSAWGRGKINLPPGIAKKLQDTPVFVGANVRDSHFRRDLARSMRVERVSEQARNQKFNVRDERQQTRQADNGRRLEMGRVTAEVTKDNKEAQRQMRQVEQQQRQVEQQQRKEARAPERAARVPQRIQLPPPPQVQQPVPQRAQQRIPPGQQRVQQRAQQRIQLPPPPQVQQPIPQSARQRIPSPPRVERRVEPRPQGERVGAPARPPNPVMQPPSRGAAQQDRKQKPPPAQPAGQDQGGGKGKGKKPGE